MTRAIVLGLVGDSGAGKTTLTRGLVRVLGDAHVTHLSADDYHRFDRAQRAELGITPLHPDANHLDILTQHLKPPAPRRAGAEARLRPRPRLLRRRRSTCARPAS